MATLTNAFIEGFASEIVKQAAGPGGVSLVELLKKADLNDIWEGIKSTAGLGERAQPTPKPVNLDPRTPDQITSQLSNYVANKSSDLLSPAFKGYDPAKGTSPYLEQSGIGEAASKGQNLAWKAGVGGLGAHGVNMGAAKALGHSITPIAPAVGKATGLANPLDFWKVPGTQDATGFAKGLRLTRGLGSIPFKLMGPLAGINMGTNPYMVEAWDDKLGLNNPSTTKNITGTIGGTIGTISNIHPVLAGAEQIGQGMLDGMTHTNDRMSNEYGAAGGLSDLLLAHRQRLKQVAPGSQDHQMLMHNLAQMREIKAPSGNEPLIDMAARGDDNPALNHLIGLLYNKNDGVNNFTFKPNAQPKTWGSRFDSVAKWLSDIGSVAAEPKALLKSNPNAEQYYGGM